MRKEVRYSMLMMVESSASGTTIRCTEALAGSLVVVASASSHATDSAKNTAIRCQMLSVKVSRVKCFLEVWESASVSPH